MKVATSILTADFNKLKEEISSIAESDYIHLDVMDGHFVPNISFGAAVLKNINKITNIPLDTHLMISNPYFFVDEFIKIGSHIITVHVEANEPLKTVKYIKSKGIKAGITLKPNTPVEALMPFLELVDLVLVMTVEPGFGGQEFMANQMEKVKILNDLRERKGYQFLIEVDGGINKNTISKVRNTGVDIVVAGSYILNQKDRNKAIRSLK